MTGTEHNTAAYRRADPPATDAPLERAMRARRTLARRGRASCEETGIKVRRRLSRLVCVVPPQVAADVGSFFDLLEAELNVKTISLASSAGSLVTLEAKPNFRSLRQTFGKTTPLAAQTATAFGQVQRLRRDLTFAVSDRIRLGIVASNEVQAGLSAHHDWVANELLAREIVFGEPPVDHQATHEPDLDGSVVRLALTREQ